MKYSKNRAAAQRQTASLKYTKLNAGDTLAFEEIVTGEIERGKQKLPYDTILTKSKSGRVKVPVAEFLRMETEGGVAHYQSEDGSDEIKMPASITIISSKGRVDKNNNPIYPVFSYNGAEKFNAGELDWAGLVASGIKADNKFEQVQDYVIKVN